MHAPCRLCESRHKNAIITPNVCEISLFNNFERDNCSNIKDRICLAPMLDQICDHHEAILTNIAKVPNRFNYECDPYGCASQTNTMSSEINKQATSNYERKQPKVKSYKTRRHDG